MSSRNNRKDFIQAVENAKSFVEIPDSEYQTYYPGPKTDKLETIRFNIIVELILDQKQQIQELEDKVRSLQGQSSASDEDSIIKAFEKLSVSPDGIIKKSTFSSPG